MQKLKAKKIIDFPNLSERGKETFMVKLVSSAEEKKGGRDYWTICLSAVSNAYKTAEVEVINEKIEELLEKEKAKKDPQIKARYRRYIQILTPYKEYRFSKLRPKLVDFLRKSKTTALLQIKGFTVEVAPSFVFSYNYRGTDEVGAIWFVAKKDGFKNAELGVFSELIYRYLHALYHKSHNINPNNCIVIDIVGRNEIRYGKLVKGEITPLLDKTLDSMSTLLKK